MSLNPAPAEFSPLPEPESTVPELRVIEGGGEGGAGVETPDLQIVADSANPEPETGEQAYDGTDEDDTPESQLLEWQIAAKATGRIVRAVRKNNTEASKQTASSSSDHYRHRGGGGWAIREYMKKLAAKDHEKECGCKYCAA